MLVAWSGVSSPGGLGMSLAVWLAIANVECELHTYSKGKQHTLRFPFVCVVLGKFHARMVGPKFMMVIPICVCV